jgi:hypothetical protein
MRIMKNLKKMFLSLGLILAMGGGLCAADPKDKKKKLNFDDDIASLLREKCGNCHNADKKSSGLIVTNFTKLMEGGSGGIAVKPQSRTVYAPEIAQAP